MNATEIATKVANLCTEIAQTHVQRFSDIPCLGCNRFSQIQYDFLTELNDYSVFEDLEEQDLDGCCVGDEGIREQLIIFERYPPRNLRILRLRDNWLWPVFLASLLRIDILQIVSANTHQPCANPLFNLQSITLLDLSNNHIGDEGVAYLCVGILKGYFTSLTTLLLDHNTITSKAANILFSTLSVRYSMYIDEPVYTDILRDPDNRENISPISMQSLKFNNINDDFVYTFLRSFGDVDRTNDVEELFPALPIGGTPGSEVKKGNTYNGTPGGANGVNTNQMNTNTTVASSLSNTNRKDKLSVEITDALHHIDKVQQAQIVLLHSKHINTSQAQILTWLDKFVKFLILTPPQVTAPVLPVGKHRRLHTTSNTPALGSNVLTKPTVKPSPGNISLTKLNLSGNDAITYNGLCQILNFFHANVTTLDMLNVDHCVTQIYKDSVNNQNFLNEDFFAQVQEQKALQLQGNHILLEDAWKHVPIVRNTRVLHHFPEHSLPNVTGDAAAQTIYTQESTLPKMQTAGSRNWIQKAHNSKNDPAMLPNNTSLYIYKDDNVTHSTYSGLTSPLQHHAHAQEMSGILRDPTDITVNPFFLQEYNVRRKTLKLHQKKCTNVADILSTIVLSLHPRVGYTAPLRILAPHDAPDIFLPVLYTLEQAATTTSHNNNNNSSNTPNLKKESRGKIERTVVPAQGPVPNPFDAVLNTPVNLMGLLSSLQNQNLKEGAICSIVDKNNTIITQIEPTLLTTHANEVNTETQRPHTNEMDADYTQSSEQLTTILQQLIMYIK